VFPTKFFKLRMANHDANRSPGTTIYFESLDFSLNDDDEAVRAPETRPPPPPLPRNHDMTARASSGSHIDYTPGAAILGNLDFVIKQESKMVGMAPTWPPLPESPDTVLEVVGDLRIVSRKRRERHKPTPPSKDDKIRR
jgi:hypothetical protein